MKLKKLLLLFALIVGVTSFAQITLFEINTPVGVRHIIKSMKYPIMGTYTFKGGEPIVTLNADGTGIYQLHDQPKRPMIWGIECSEDGETNFKKGFNSAAYTLWYQFTDAPQDTPSEWKSVELTVHFNTQKIYIQGERVKDFSPELKKKNLNKP